MAHRYLDEFRQHVRAAHDPTGHTCHWTASDELVPGDPLKRGEPGPCNCPSPPASLPCSQHQQYDCANTAKVLGQATDAEAHYAPLLAKLGEAMTEIEDTIRSAEEFIKNWIANGGHRGDAIKDGTFTDIIRGHVAPDKPWVRFILEDLLVDVKPSSDLAPAGCDCECWKNKQKRLKAEKDFSDTLADQASDQAAEVLKAWNDGQPTFSNTLGRVLRDSVKVVEGVFTRRPKHVVSGLKDLLAYYVEGLEAGAELYILYKAIAEIGELKRDAILAVIYHDQQLKAPTCVQADGPGKAKRPTGTTPGQPPSGTHEPPEEEAPLLETTSGQAHDCDLLITVALRRGGKGSVGVTITVAAPDPAGAPGGVPAAGAQVEVSDSGDASNHDSGQTGAGGTSRLALGPLTGDTVTWKVTWRDADGKQHVCEGRTRVQQK